MTFNLNPTCRLVYSAKTYHQGGNPRETTTQRVLTESYKILNPNKPKLFWFKLTRISLGGEETAVDKNIERVHVLFKE